MQTKLSENVQPVTSKHIAVGHHCIDMLLKKDENSAEKKSLLARPLSKTMRSKGEPLTKGKKG